MNALLLAIALSSVQPQPTINVKETVIVVVAKPKHPGQLFNCTPHRETLTGGAVRTCSVNP